MKLHSAIADNSGKRSFLRARHDLQLRAEQSDALQVRCAHPLFRRSVERLKYTAMSCRSRSVSDNSQPGKRGKHPEDRRPIQMLMPSTKKRVGYPAQKPLAPLQRIASAGSNECAIVLNPFCGRACQWQPPKALSGSGLVSPSARRQLIRSSSAGECCGRGDYAPGRSPSHERDDAAKLPDYRTQTHAPFGRQKGRCT